MITILFFAQLQEEVGKEKIELAWKEQTVAELKQSLKEQYHLSSLDTVMVALNEEYALNDDVIKPGDTIALIPPVSGG